MDLSKKTVPHDMWGAHDARKGDVMSRTTIATLESRMNAQDERLDRIEAMLGRIADSLESATQQKTTKTTTSSSKKSAPKQRIPFTKHDGTVVYAASQAQWNAWKRSQDGYAQRKANFENWAERKATYTPSKELIEAIRKDRCSVTFKVAKAEYGYVGDKESLRALKAEILGC